MQLLFVSRSCSKISGKHFPGAKTLLTIRVDVGACVELALGFPSEASACNVGDLGSIPELGRSPGEGNGNPFQYSCLENPMDRGAWQATIHGVAKSRTQLRDFTFFHFGHQKCPHVLGIQNNPCGQTVLQLPWLAKLGLFRYSFFHSCAHSFGNRMIIARSHISFLTMFSAI